MAFGKSNSNESNWMSFSDVMTGLMVIFMFIAISYMADVQKKQVMPFEELRATKEQLYAELEKEFKGDFSEWEVELDEDLSIKFTNPEVLFNSGKSDIRPNIADILNQFLPRYFAILLDTNYTDKIAEIRIEGHTDTVPAPKYDSDPYIGNIKLSQLRSAEVLKYFRGMTYYEQLSDSDEEQLQYWLTANGLSYGRTLDSNKELTAVTGKPINNQYSRRVEFRIITKTENLIEQVLKEIGK